MWFILPALLLVFFLIPSGPLFAAENSIEVTNVFEVSDGAVDGDIVVARPDKGLIRTAIPYDTQLFGVIQNNALLVYRRYDNKGVPIARNGIAYVNVATANGSIQAGDYITSSEIPGKGQRASKSGYVIGHALGSLRENEGEQLDFLGRKVTTGNIPVALRIEYAEINSTRFFTRIFEPLSQALFINVQNPDKFSQIIRYAAAALVIIVGFMVGFLTFARSIPKAVEAIGRNPLARTSIYLTISVNIFFTLMTTLIGVMAAILILRI